LAEAGYVAIVPDFYHRHSGDDGSPVTLTADGTGRTRGLELIDGLCRDQVRADVDAAVKQLSTEEFTTGATAMLGLSVGGHIAYYAATQVPLAALVVFYPGWLTGTDIALSRPEPTLALTDGLAAQGTPLLFLVGDEDRLFTAEQREQIAARLEQARVRHELVVYPDTPHGFFADERETYRPAVAEDAWNRTLATLAAGFGD
jgi:carboxymethylenebutenolidase